MKWKILIVSFLCVFIVSLVGSFMTNTNYYSANSNLIPFTLPPFIFGIVWTILYILIAISMYLCLSSKKTNNQISKLFAINLVLNMFWTFFFFALQNPIIAFIDLILIWISIIFLLVYTKKISKTASLLLWPYFLWVTFAAYLNFLFI